MTATTPKYTKLDLKDANGLRRRNAPRQPEKDPLPLNNVHLRLLEFIHLFGGFSTTDLMFEFAKLDGITIQKVNTYVRDQLLKRAMFHNHGVIEKPREQFTVENRYGHSRIAHGYPLVYKISEKGEELLKEVGMWNKHAPKAHGWYKHQMMTACLYQMFYLNARRARIDFTPQHKLKPRERFINVSEVKVFPDAVFLLHLHKPFLFFFEMDRATERGKGTKRKTWGKSIEFYKSVFDRKLYKDNYDIPEDHLPFLATVTVGANMEHKILEHIQDQYPDGFARMLVHTTRAFGPTATDFYPPKYFNLLNENWHRFGYPPASLMK